jgi:hypothetical protein
MRIGLRWLRGTRPYTPNTLNVQPPDGRDQARTAAAAGSETVFVTACDATGRKSLEKLVGLEGLEPSTSRL